MRSKTLYRRMSYDLSGGYEYISVWALTRKTTTTSVRSDLFRLNQSCRYYKNLLPLLQELGHEQND